MGVLLAALSAVFYGSADFMGGLASRRASPLSITWYSQMVGLASITLVALLVPSSSVAAMDWVWGGLGGCSGAIGLLLLYGALATGPMAVVAPVTAVCSAVVPVLVGVVEGDRPSGLAVAGIVVALPAIVLVASGDTGTGEVRVVPRVIAESVVSGVMFGLFFVFFARAGSGAGMWPTVAARLASVSLLSVVVLVQVARRRGAISVGTDRVGRLSTAALPLVAGAGLFDVGANALYLVASRHGLLSLISVVSAMYPAATVALARVVLRERLARQQLLGLLLAGLAVGFVAAGR
ncbi:MAG: EamA family transporter [Acidimicrobiales bacterium]